MSAPSVPFVTSLRVGRPPIRLGPPDAPTIPIRVQVAGAWDVVRIEAPPTETVLAVKVAAIAELAPGADQRDYVIKLRGFEVLDEQLTLAQAGAEEASIFLVMRRRRRPVR